MWTQEKVEILIWKKVEFSKCKSGNIYQEKVEISKFWKSRKSGNMQQEKMEISKLKKWKFWN